MNFDPPASLVICRSLRCCDGRSRSSVGPKAFCRVGPIFPGPIGPLERGSLRRVSAGDRTGASGMERDRDIRVRRPQTHKFEHPATRFALIAAMPPRWSAGTSEHGTDTTMQRYGVGPSDRVSTPRRLLNSGAAAVIRDLPSCPLAGSPVSISPTPQSPSLC
jgi:hypothetical protein